MCAFADTPTLLGAAASIICEQLDLLRIARNKKSDLLAQAGLGIHALWLRWETDCDLSGRDRVRSIDAINQKRYSPLTETSAGSIFSPAFSAR